MSIGCHELGSRPKYAVIFGALLSLLLAITFLGIPVLRAQPRNASVQAANQDAQPSPTTSEPALFTALEEQLGLTRIHPRSGRHVHDRSH